MKAVRCEDRRMKLVDVPAPTGDSGGEGRALVQVVSAAICASDLHMAAAGFLNPEVTLGHEIGGVTEDGTPVAVEPVGTCGRKCEWCASGRYNVCPRAARNILGFGADGGMAEMVAVDPAWLVRLPGGVSPADACLVEPLAVCLHGFRRVGLRADDRMLIVGGGALGLAAAATARQLGARVSLIARHDAQKAAAERLGAELLEATDEASRGFDLTVDAAGTPDAMAAAVRRVRRNGTVLVLASYLTRDLVAPKMEVALKELSLVASAMYGRGPEGRDIEDASKLLATIPELAGTIISHRFPLDAAEEAFAAAEDRAGGAIKVVIEPSSG